MLNEIKTQGGKVTLYTERPKSKYSYTLICTDIDVDDDVQTLTLISNSHEIEADYVMYDFRSVKKQFPNVETLVITEMVIDVYVSNMMFPILNRWYQRIKRIFLVACWLANAMTDKPSCKMFSAIVKIM